jgi:hypothetical protein
MKPCRNCNIVKPLELFHKNKACKDGRASWCKECQSIMLKEARKDPLKGDKFRHYRYKGLIKKRYGITIEQYDKMFEEQNGSCAICKKICKHGVLFGKRLSVDHDHNTKFVRGLLCQKCNRGLGLFNDNTEIMEEAIKYIIRAKQNEQKTK